MSCPISLATAVSMLTIRVLGAMMAIALAACANGATQSGASNKPTSVKIAAEGPFTGDQASRGAGALLGFGR